MHPLARTHPLSRNAKLGPDEPYHGLTPRHVAPSLPRPLAPSALGVLGALAVPISGTAYAPDGRALDSRSAQGPRPQPSLAGNDDGCLAPAPPTANQDRSCPAPPSVTLGIPSSGACANCPTRVQGTTPLRVMHATHRHNRERPGPTTLRPSLPPLGVLGDLAVHHPVTVPSVQPRLGSTRDSLGRDREPVAAVMPDRGMTRGLRSTHQPETRNQEPETRRSVVVVVSPPVCFSGTFRNLTFRAPHTQTPTHPHMPGAQSAFRTPHSAFRNGRATPG